MSAVHGHFVYTGLPCRVLFGVDAVASLAAELDALGARRAVLLTTPSHAATAAAAAAALGDRCVGTLAESVQHVPQNAIGEAEAFAVAHRADVLVALGGGSSIGLAKALALSSALPIVAIPTTYSGSEMTPIYGITRDGAKRTGRDASVLPKTVLYDPTLLLSLPVATAAASGMNAMAHCVEALYARDANPVVSLIAEEGIRALGDALPRIADGPMMRGPRSDALYGSWLAGIALGSVGMALHHKIAHVLGGSFGLRHAQTHAALLPHTAAYNAAAAPDALARVARALHATDAPSALFDLLCASGAPTALGPLGFDARDTQRAIELLTQSPYDNPRPIEVHAVRALLDGAREGVRPTSSSYA